jgi:hypothetical protein
VGDLLQQGVDWLDGQRVAHLSRTVTYQRGGESIVIAATLGATSLEVTDDAGATVRSPQVDFIVSADGLVLAGTVTTPQVGDRIRVAGVALDQVRVYEVLALPDGKHYRPCDPGGRMLRIHTKLVDQEQV